jgi:DNA-binding transcriptional LysR family regulator
VIELRLLVSFSALAHRLSFTAVADDLHISQSTLSRQMQALEAEFGFELFRRSRKGTELTEQGRSILASVEEVLAATSKLSQAASSMRRGVDAVTVGFMPGTDSEMIIAAYRQMHPNLDISAVYVPISSQIQVVLSGAVDLTFVRFPFDSDPPIASVPLFEEPVVAAVPVSFKNDLPRPVADLSVPELERQLRAVSPSTSPEQALTSVATSATFALLPVGIAAYFRPRDVGFVRVHGVEPGMVGLAFDAERNVDAVKSFMDFARSWMAPTSRRLVDELTGDALDVGISRDAD